MMLSNLRQIEAFRAAMEMGSATAASEVLHVSQPAVSRLLKDLEQALGFRLFERRARGLVPTQDAEVLYDVVKRAFIGMDQINQVADAIRDKTTGNVRVIALPAFADGWVANFNGLFIKSHRGITVEAETGNRSAVVDGVAAQSFDVGISILPVHDPLIETAPLFESGAVLAMNAADPLAGQSVIPIQKLHRCAMLGLPENSPFHTAITAALRRAKVEPRVVGRARTQRAICQMASTGAGVALVDKAVMRDFARSDLAFRPIDPPIQWTVGTLVNSRVARSIATESYLADIRSAFSDTPASQ